MSNKTPPKPALSPLAALEAAQVVYIEAVKAFLASSDVSTPQQDVGDYRLQFYADTELLSVTRR